MNAGQPNFCPGSQQRARKPLPPEFEYVMERCRHCRRTVRVKKDGRFSNHSSKGAA